MLNKSFVDYFENNCHQFLLDLFWNESSYYKFSSSSNTVFRKFRLSSHAPKLTQNNLTLGFFDYFETFCCQFLLDLISNESLYVHMIIYLPFCFTSSGQTAQNGTKISLLIIFRNVVINVLLNLVWKEKSYDCLSSWSYPIITRYSVLNLRTKILSLN